MGCCCWEGGVVPEVVSCSGGAGGARTPEVVSRFSGKLPHPRFVSLFSNTPVPLFKQSYPRPNSLRSSSPGTEELLGTAHL